MSSSLFALSLALPILVARPLFIMDAPLGEKNSLYRKAGISGKKKKKHSVYDPSQALISANYYLFEIYVLWAVLHLENLHLSHM